MNILKDNTFWSAISSMCAVITVVIAFYSIRMTISDRKKDRETSRSYFAIYEPGIKKLPESPPYRIQITFSNIGRHPSDGLEGNIFFIDASLQSKPESIIPLSVANDIPPNSPTPWHYDNFIPPKNMPKKYIVVLIEYYDPILKKEFNQPFFMKWDGVKDGFTHPDFTYITKSERKKIKDYLKMRKLLTSRSS